MLLAIALSFGLVALSIIFHYRVLLWLSVSSQFKMDKQGKVLRSEEHTSELQSQ